MPLGLGLALEKMLLKVPAKKNASAGGMWPSALLFFGTPENKRPTHLAMQFSPHPTVPGPCPEEAQNSILPQLGQML